MKQALVFSDRNGAELEPINSRYSPAMLSIGGRPVLENTLILCQQLGIEEVWLVTGANDEGIREYFESGARWSLNILYIRSRRRECPDSVRRRIGSRLAANFIALRGDIYRPLNREYLSSDNTELPGTKRFWIEMTAGEQEQSLAPLTWSEDGQSLPGEPKSPDLLCTLAAYHQLAIGLDKEQLRQSQPGALSQLHHSLIESGNAIIGDFSEVENGCRMTGTNAIGRHCLISRGACLHNTVILDDTFIGPGMSLENCIVDRNRIIRVDLGVTLNVDDPFFASSCTESPFRALVFKALERILAGSFLMALCVGFRPRQPSPVPLRSLLAKAVRGEISLFGKLNSPPEGSEEMPWHSAWQAIPEGAISRSSLVYGMDRDATLTAVAEVELDQPRSLASLIRYTGLYLRACFWAG